ncbi:transglutaminase-like cysteine peptidase [Aminobacter sp. J44]|jgi:predicted transglutaminase-like cysteine proteinase|uniref:transglutaminase-like cysteine peptidase n=1 Tax=Aminobacter sp. J44 TaxID=935262 RepID=UPI00119BEA3B|nr:putative transglutaminase-like cysteine proteinase [Aminobacter sp. J44]
MWATLRRWQPGIFTASLLLIAAATGSTTQASGAGAMITGGLTSQPIGHYEFCKRFASECSIRPRDSGPVIVTDALWNQISEVNKAVNAAVKPMSDYDVYGQDEYWAYPEQSVGDCEDYVLEKRRQLNALGISLSNLLITVLRKPDGEGHAVLTVRTNRGDFILDNLNDELRAWNETGYQFLKRQAANHTGRWVTIYDDQNMLVGSVD